VFSFTIDLQLCFEYVRSSSWFPQSRNEGRGPGLSDTGTIVVETQDGFTPEGLQELVIAVIMIGMSSVSFSR